jgi:Flp pilus assembly protein TadD
VKDKKEKGVTMRRLSVGLAVAGIVLLCAGAASPADQTPAGDKVQTQKQERIYGSQLMTEQERADYRTKMRAAKTAKEREQIRKAHHELMQARAKERGVTLPDEPPARGGGMGPGGMGGGVKSGGGMGSGGGGGGR